LQSQIGNTMPIPADSSQIADAAPGLLALAHAISRLKSVPRTGWLDRGIGPTHAESVADHSFGVALLAFAAALEHQQAGADLDPQRVIVLALLHDLAEAETGDLPPYDPDEVPDEDDPAGRQAFLDRRHVRNEGRASAKRIAEDAAMRRLLADLPAVSRSAIGQAWEELREGISAEARFVKQADRLETFLQSRFYLENDPGLAVDSFRREVEETIDDPLLAAVRDAALNLEERTATR
jgi:putative hydrolase of HD superfamily